MPKSIEYHLQSEDQLCFVRIPKTASTTLLSIINTKFGAEELCPLLEGEIYHSAPGELDKYRFFGAHFDYNIYQFLPKKPVYFTVLRHPVNRVISLFKHCQADTSDSIFSQFLREATQQGIRDFVCSSDPTIRIRTSNLQTRQIAAGLGTRHLNPFAPDPIEAELSDAELLRLAKQHLDEFAFTGLTEQFQASLFLLYYTFGWCPVAQYQNRRVAGKKQSSGDDLDPETIAAILSLNELDWELYQYGQQLFEARFAQMLEELQARYKLSESDRLTLNQLTLNQLNGSENRAGENQAALFHALEKHYEQRYAESNGEPVRSVDFNSRQAIPGTGWQRRKWIGPGTTAHLDFSLASGTDYRIRICIGDSAAPDILDSFALQANGEPIALKTLLKRKQTTLFEGQIPQAIVSKNPYFTRLTFSVNRTIPMPQLLKDGSADGLLVGLAVRGVQIIPSSESAIAQKFAQKYWIFPQQDSAWIAVRDFIQPQIRETETIAAPVEFVECFSQQYISCAESLTQSPDWVVIHKGLLPETNPALLTWTFKNLRSVFANEVFVVFSNRTDLPALDRKNPHLQALRHEWKQIGRSKMNSSESEAGILGQIRSKLKRFLALLN
ncbi:sulfotransferase family 2 domain-containing protein [Leptolyngbya ohadii]|uniref:sulfotransferase family 2 domain-containing protein n=1 Tax=Leptolyngbya ohadii TaxID=1962290 RepID=UPI000B5A04C5|nr:sulfotransferase family 2 domain-containing protein [Leptolyngbya ohadii]